jgi:hypothetical protein
MVGPIGFTGIQETMRYDLNLTWQIQRHISLQASYVYMPVGAYVHDGGGHDVNYFSTTFTFLF